jgi:hypothetical protein
MNGCLKYKDEGTWRLRIGLTQQSYMTSTKENKVEMNYSTSMELPWVDSAGESAPGVATWTPLL